MLDPVGMHLHFYNGSQWELIKGMEKAPGCQLLSSIRSTLRIPPVLMACLLGNPIQQLGGHDEALAVRLFDQGDSRVYLEPIHRCQCSKGSLAVWNEDHLSQIHPKTFMRLDCFPVFFFFFPV